MNLVSRQFTRRDLDLGLAPLGGDDDVGAALRKGLVRVERRAETLSGRLARVVIKRGGGVNVNRRRGVGRRPHAGLEGRERRLGDRRGRAGSTWTIRPWKKLPSTAVSARTACSPARETVRLRTRRRCVGRARRAGESLAATSALAASKAASLASSSAASLAASSSAATFPVQHVMLKKLACAFVMKKLSCPDTDNDISTDRDISTYNYTDPNMSVTPATSSGPQLTLATDRSNAYQQEHF